MMPDRSVPLGEIRRFGEHALIVGVEGPAAVRRLTRALTATEIDGLVEVVGGLATVMVTFEPSHGHGDVLRAAVARRMIDALDSPESDAPDSKTAGLVEIPCTFTGPDLHEVAEMVHCSPEAVVAMVTAQPLTVAVVGFSPGFAYLDGLPQRLQHIRRRVRPRTVVPAGSVALANGFAAVYPMASPGGWQLVGHTEEPLFSAVEHPFARLAPGDRVRFTHLTGESLAGGVRRTGRVPTLGRPSEEEARPVFMVEQTGVHTALQDGGRRGMAALGIPAAGPADPHAFRLANQLVGNAPDACALETTARGPTLRSQDQLFVAVVGGSPDLRLDGQPVMSDRVVPVHAGQLLAVDMPRRGFRSYIAIAGGFVGPAVLGSVASDQLSGLGPGPLGRGAQLWAAPMATPLGDHLRHTSWPHSGDQEPIALRVVPGPHSERFASDAFDSLGSIRFTVEAESNRVGLRLRRDPLTPPLMRASGAPMELDSQAMVIGAVQIPPSGEPVILLSDHATLGGYPVVAVVVAADHGTLGQCWPGAQVVLAPVSYHEAEAAFEARQRELRTAVVGRYPFVVD